MAKLFQPFTEWIKEKPFYVREYWNPETGMMESEGQLILQPFQERILDYCLHQNDNGTFRYKTVVFSTIKKSGKTTIAAAVGSWFADQAPPGSEIYCLANSLEHAEGRVMKDIKYNAKMQGGCRVVGYEVTYPNETFVRSLGQSYTSVAGSRHALTLWDELWGQQSDADRRVWDEMTPIPTIPHSLRFVATYAGFYNESDLLWDLYIQGVGKDEHEDGKGQKIEALDDLPCYENGGLFVYWNHEPTMPWQDEEYYKQALIAERPAAFLRLHENRWVTTLETFIPVEWWDESTKFFPSPADIWQEHPYRQYPVFVGVDAATKRDCTAVVGVTYDAKRGKVIVLFHKIWTPRKNDPLDLEVTLCDYLIKQSKAYNLAIVGYDPKDIIQLMMKLKSAGLPMQEFPQTVTNMVNASTALYDTMKFKNLEAYPDDELKEHIQNAIAEQEGRGFRIVKDKHSRLVQKPIDACIAMAIATHLAIAKAGIDISQPIVIRTPFSDMKSKKGDNPHKLPWMFVD